MPSSIRLVPAVAFALLCLLIAPHDAAAQTNTPGAPTIDKVTARAGWLLVEWSAPSSNGGSDITAYDIRRIETDATDKADSNWDVTDDIWTTVDVELRYALRNLANGTEYDVQMRAVNTNGDGDWSSTETGTPEIVCGHHRRPSLTVRADDTAHWP